MTAQLDIPEIMSLARLRRDCPEEYAELLKNMEVVARDMLILSKKLLIEWEEML